MTSTFYRRTLLRSAASPALAAVPVLGTAARASAQAAAWPTGPVTIVVPFPPRGPSDIIAGVLAPRMQAAIGKPVVIDHRPGAGGERGAVSVSQAPPDGHTIMIGTVGTWAINPSVRQSLGYDPVRGFTPITLATTTPNLLVVNPRATEADDLVALMFWLKRPGARVTYATSGVGSADHLLMEMFRQVLRIEAIHSPTDGTAPLVQALVAGTVAQVGFGNIGPLLPYVREGRLRAIMIASNRRSPLLPDVPTAAESGQRGFVVDSWHGIQAPPGMPEALQARVHAAVTGALRAPDAVQRLAEVGYTVMAGTPQEFSTFQGREIARWRRVVEAANIRS